jgi:hypothetical protein
MNDVRREALKHTDDIAVNEDGEQDTRPHTQITAFMTPDETLICCYIGRPERLASGLNLSNEPKPGPEAGDFGDVAEARKLLGRGEVPDR